MWLQKKDYKGFFCVQQMTKALLVRHGETEWNSSGLVQGHTDIPLSQHGIRQAQDFARHPSFTSVITCPYTIYSSPLKRASKTAEIILAASGIGERAVQLDDRLKEKSHGPWEGKSRVEYLAAMSDWDSLSETDRWECSLVGEEPNRSALNRLLEFLEGMPSVHIDDEVVLVLSHGGLMRLLYLHLTGMRFAEVTGFRNLGYIFLELNGSKLSIIDVGGLKTG